MSKRIVITGASRGIGLATAQVFLQHGWRVIGSSTAGTAPLSEHHFSVCALDLSSAVSVRKFAAQLPSFDVLINNAAVLLDQAGEVHISRDRLKKTFEINVFGTIQLTELCLKHFRTDGQIINIASGWGSLTANDSATMPHYKLSKVCLNMFTRLLDERCPGLTVSSFDPGWVKTDMGTDAAPREASEVARELYELVLKKKESGIFWKHGQPRNW